MVAMKIKSRELGKEIWELLLETIDEWQTDNASQLAAGMAFYAVFSAAPLLIVIIAIASTVFGQEAARGQILEQARRIMGTAGTGVLEMILTHARSKSQTATVVGIATVLFGATAFFANLQSALNAIWEVTNKPGKILRPFLRKRLLSFAMVLGCGVLLLFSLIVTAALAAAGEYVPKYLIAPAYLLHVANFVISFLVITLVFGIIYKVLPDVRISWEDVWIGSAVTSLLFAIGKSLIGIYLGHSSLGSSYGAAGAVVVLLAWIYYSTQVFFFGAEFTQVYARRYSSGIEPDASAVRFDRKLEE
jgi:membrane protein